jgi:hypothetical protein
MPKLLVVLLLAMFAYLALGSNSDAEPLQEGTEPTQHLRLNDAQLVTVDDEADDEADVNVNNIDAQLRSTLFSGRRRRRCGWACKAAKKVKKHVKKAAKAVKKHVKKAANFVKKGVQKFQKWRASRWEKKVLKHQRKVASLLKMQKGNIVEATSAQINQMTVDVVSRPTQQGPEWWLYHKSGAFLSKRKFVGKVSCPCADKGVKVSREQAQRRIIAQIGTVKSNDALAAFIPGESKKFMKIEAYYRMKLAFAAMLMVDCWTHKCAGPKGAEQDEAQLDDLLENSEATHAGWNTC